jgi:hypothetical protein
MVLLDWLLGQSNVGWLKTALLAGLIGIGIYGLLGGSLEAGSSSRFYFIAIGYPVLWLIRKLYWSQRRSYFIGQLAVNNPKVHAEIASLEGKNDVLQQELALIRRDLLRKPKTKQ